MGYIPKVEAIADDIIQTLIEDKFFLQRIKINVA